MFSTDFSTPLLSFCSKGHCILYIWARPAGTGCCCCCLPAELTDYSSRSRAPGAFTVSVSLTQLVIASVPPLHYQLVSLAVSELVTIRCAVVAVPLGPDAWPHPRTLLLGSWALCWTFERSCSWCWAQGSRRQWCRMSRTSLQKWIICSCSFTDCEAELGLDPEGKPHCHCLFPSCILPDVSLKFLID